MAFLHGIYYSIAVKVGLSHSPDFKTNLCPPLQVQVWFNCRRNTKALVHFGCFHGSHGRNLPINLIQAKATCESGNSGNSLNFQVRENCSVNVFVHQNSLGLKRCWTGFVIPKPLGSVSVIPLDRNWGEIRNFKVWEENSLGFLSVGFPSLFL